MSEAARTRRDDARYEPRLEVPAREPSPAAADPLAELARLVGQDDPFRRVFHPGADQARAPRHDRGPSSAAEAAPPAGVQGAPGFHGHDGRDAHRDHQHAEPHAGQDYAQDQAWHDEHGDHFGETDHADAHSDGYAHPDAYGDASYGEHDAHGAEDHRGYAVGHDAYDAYHDEAGFADGHLAAEAAAEAVTATLPDMWARQNDGVEGPALGGSGMPLHGFDGDRRVLGASSARRPLAVLAAVLVLTGGGLAASFLVKGPSAPGAAAAGSGRAAPTIMAAAGPTKVKMDDAATTAPEDQDAALLNKNGNVSSGPVRIVSSQEQPADLGQLPKSSDLGSLADGARPLPPAAPSPFPEPKKVKTFVVHPDGTMLSGDGAPAAKDGAGPDATGTPAPATPRTANRGATTPSTAPADALAALAASPLDGPSATGAVDAAPARSPRQPASPGARVASAKPNDTAGAPAASGTSGGGFGVQLASSPVEADADAAFAKLKRKYPAQLGTLTASVHKAETGDRPIYRVRVGSMSQDEANTLCSQLKGAGGSCYVVHN